MKVYEAIIAVKSALAEIGISKDRQNQQQNFKFRGIDDIYNVASKIMADHGLCMLPRIKSRTCVERPAKGGGILFSVTVEAEYDFVSIEDGSKHTVTTIGEAMDSGDKATNKAMSAAHKYALIQSFSIPTEGENDADGATPQLKSPLAKSVSQDTFDRMEPEEQDFLRSIAKQAKEFFAKADPDGALAYLRSQTLSTDEQVAINALFDSQQRSAMKRAAKQAAQPKEQATA